MNAATKKELNTYFDERAPEYDEFYRGKGPAIHHYGGMYQADVEKIQEMVSGFGKGHLIDIACGTGYWVPFYAGNCEQLTCLDQSANMLEECRNRTQKLNMENEPVLLQADFFNIELEQAGFDSAVLGLMVSYLHREDEKAFFERINQILTPRARLLIIDSLWNPKRSKYRNKEGVEERTLNDGRKFKVYKRYLDKADIARTFKANGFAIKSVYLGDMLFAATATRA